MEGDPAGDSASRRVALNPGTEIAPQFVQER
jgi:hypothetical protein